MVDAMREAINAIDRATVKVNKLCSGKDRWTLSVPARPDYDPDIIIMDALRKARDIIARPMPDLTADIAKVRHHIRSSNTEALAALDRIEAAIKEARDDR